MADRSFLIENSQERKRLSSLVARLSEDELSLKLPNGLTVAATLAHLAFWDRRVLILIQRWKQNGVSPSPVDTDAINDALASLLLAISPRIATQLACTAAEATDSELEEVSDDLIEAIQGLGGTVRLNRSLHRRMHLDEIEVLLKARN